MSETFAEIRNIDGVGDYWDKVECVCSGLGRSKCDLNYKKYEKKRLNKMAKKNKMKPANKVEAELNIMQDVSSIRTICTDAKQPVQGNYYAECPKCGFIHVEVLNDNK